MLAPGRDDTTRGADGGAGGVGATGVDPAVDVVAAGATEVAGATGGAAVGAAATGGVATTCGVSIGAATTGSLGAGAGVAVSSAFFLARGLAAVFVSFSSAPASLSAAFLAAFFGFSTTSRFRPFSSAWRRTRSACASTMLDDGDDAPMPIELQRSTTSFEVMPSSLASVETRTLLPLKRWHPRQKPVQVCFRR
jgi:hypothetical protein